MKKEAFVICIKLIHSTTRHKATTTTKHANRCTLDVMRQSQQLCSLRWGIFYWNRLFPFSFAHPILSRLWSNVRAGVLCSTVGSVCIHVLLCRLALPVSVCMVDVLQNERVAWTRIYSSIRQSFRFRKSYSAITECQLFLPTFNRGMPSQTENTQYFAECVYIECA